MPFVLPAVRTFKPRQIYAGLRSRQHFMFDLTAIHPFPDSNGKVALVLGDLFLLKQGLHPPYFAKYRGSNKQELYAQAERYELDSKRDLSDLYPVVLRLYEECGQGLGGGCQHHENAADD